MLFFSFLVFISNNGLCVLLIQIFMTYRFSMIRFHIQFVYVRFAFDKFEHLYGICYACTSKTFSFCFRFTRRRCGKVKCKRRLTCFSFHFVSISMLWKIERTIVVHTQRLSETHSLHVRRFSVCYFCFVVSEFSFSWNHLSILSPSHL